MYSRYAGSVPEVQFGVDVQEHVALQEEVPRQVVVNRVLILAHDRYGSIEFDLLGPGGCWFSWQTRVTKSLNVSYEKDWA